MVDIAPEDAQRARFYGLLARFLSHPPTEDDLAAARSLEGGTGALGQGVTALAAVAGAVSPGEVREEYHDLFIGVARGELIPYASYYLTGFLHEKPLAKLRADMARLNITPDSGTSDPEDHIAALLDMMAGLITGAFGEPAPLPQQKSFFQTHLASWAPWFFRDLEAARTSVFYAPLGTLGREFLAIEEAAFEMAEGE